MHFSMSTNLQITSLMLGPLILATSPNLIADLNTFTYTVEIWENVESMSNLPQAHSVRHHRNESQYL